MSFVRIGDYPIAFRPDEVVGLDVFGGGGGSLGAQNSSAK